MKLPFLQIALWETPLAVRAGSDGNGDLLESALPILAAVAEAAARGQRWLLTKPKPRPKPALFGAQIGTTVEELGKEQLADLAAAYPETLIIAALERVQKRFEAPFEATISASGSSTGSPDGSLEGDAKEGSVAGTSEALEGPEGEYDAPMTTERELYQLANAPTPAGGLPHIDDTSAAVLALKFALKHPLVKVSPMLHFKEGRQEIPEMHRAVLSTRYMNTESLKGCQREHCSSFYDTYPRTRYPAYRTASPFTLVRVTSTIRSVIILFPQAFLQILG